MRAVKRLLAFATGGGVLGAMLVGGPAGIVGGLLLGGVAEEAWSRARGKKGAIFGEDPQGVAQIEEARFAKDELAQRLFGRPDVPWWLVGVGIGGNPGSYYLLVSVSDTPPEIHTVVPRSYQGVPVVVDATGLQPQEMRTGL